MTWKRVKSLKDKSNKKTGRHYTAPQRASAVSLKCAWHVFQTLGRKVKATSGLNSHGVCSPVSEATGLACLIPFRRKPVIIRRVRLFRLQKLVSYFLQTLSYPATKGRGQLRNDAVFWKRQLIGFHAFHSFHIQFSKSVGAFSILDIISQDMVNVNGRHFVSA